MTPPLRWKSPCELYTVEITRRCYRSMLKLAREHLPNEVGTSLVGSYSQDGRKANVTGIAPLSPDSRATRTTFQRGVEGLGQFFEKVFGRFRGRRHYVGEWHSHGYSAPSPSPTDDVNQTEIAHDPRTACPEAILVIIGGDFDQQMQLRAFVYSRTRGKITLQPA